ncbi:codanin-1 isoform X1 [Rhinatrema bivittatum]|uniref:codanin-1 isoform X1 n=1 Tax=Rhinatrema bivittatum TaxID=194408 RepID=UPI001127E31B|nr:codanin-1 isoform X1 [Rhinatrema bivittatum]
MAAVLELVLREEVSVSALLSWIRKSQGRQDSEENHVNTSLASLSLLQKDFVPFLLNYLREQTSQILTNGPSTPAKTPNSKVHETSRSHGNQRTERNPEKRTSLSAGPRGSRTQLFSQTSSRSCTSDTTFSSFPSASSGSSVFKSNLSSSCSGFPDVAFHNSPNFGSPMLYHSERRSAQKISLGNFMIPALDNQPPRRGRRKNSSGNTYGRQVVRDLGRSLNEVDSKGENVSWSGTRRSLPDSVLINIPHPELNVNNLEEFPPMAAACGLASKTKPSRRINPTPVSAERLLSKPKTCFTSTPLSHSPNGRFESGMSPETLDAKQAGNCTPLPLNTSSNLQEEREMLKKERHKLLHETSLDGLALDPITPTKQSFSRSVSLSSDSLVTCADVSKVSCHKQLELLAQLYSNCISENLVPNIFLELFFVLQLLTSRGTSAANGENDTEIPKGCQDTVERQHFRSVHNCVYFAVQVLDYHFQIISHLEKGTLKLLAESERITAFSSGLHERLMEAYTSSTAKVSLLLPSCIQSVSFQPETDNRSNFPSDKAFHIFKKQRDIFYELLREWEDNHKQPGWDFERCLGNRIRAMMAQLSPASNHSHFARLFQKQLIQMCKNPIGGGGGSSSGDAPDQDVLNMLGSDNLNRLKRLQERFIVPQSISGPCPPPAFPGCQEFFKDFILSAGSYQFNQHLLDSMCQKILELDGISLVEHEPSDGEADMDKQDERERFTSVLMTLRLLAKFLGFITFLPYRTPEAPTRDLLESAVTLRNQSLPVLDVLEMLKRCIRMRRIILTVPWTVEFLSLVDHVAPLLDYYSRVFSLLLHLYRCMILTEEKEMSFLNKLLILAVLGWLFQVPSVPEELFFRCETWQEGFPVDSTGAGPGLDFVPLVDQQLLYICCPYLSELRKLLTSFVTGSGAKNGGFIRKITPTAAEPLVHKTSHAEKKLQVELEQAFFHNQPPSLRRTVEFVAERVGSNCVKHIRATLVAELVKRAETLLKDKINEDSSNHSQLLDCVCSQLCEDGKQALDKGQEFCRKKGPEALRVLLPEETSAAVLRSAEDIAVGLAIEKACTWLSTNIVALIKKEVKTTFNRMLKSQGAAASAGFHDVQDRKKCCPEGCQHRAPLPSQIITEIKDILCIVLGPRAEGEAIHYVQLENLLCRLSQTLQCRKYTSPTAEQQLAKCTVELASLLVSDQISIQGIPKPQTQKEAEKEQAQMNPVCSLLQLLLSVWRKDFLVPVPLHILFSLKNVGYIADAQLHEWDLFLFLLHGLGEHGIMGYTQIEQYLHSLQKFPWPPDVLSELERMSIVFRSEHFTEEPNDSIKVCKLVKTYPDTKAAKS